MNLKLLLFALGFFASSALADRAPMCDQRDLNGAKGDAQQVFLGELLKIEKKDGERRLQFRIKRAWKGPTKGKVWVKQAFNVTDTYGMKMEQRSFKKKSSYLIFLTSEGTLGEGCGWEGLADSPAEATGSMYVLDNGPIENLSMLKIRPALKMGGEDFKRKVVTRIFKLSEQGDKQAGKLLADIALDKKSDKSMRKTATTFYVASAIKSPDQYAGVFKLVSDSNSEVSNSACFAILSLKDRAKDLKKRLIADLDALYKKDKKKYDVTFESWTPVDAIGCLGGPKSK